MLSTVSVNAITHGRLRDFLLFPFGSQNAIPNTIIQFQPYDYTDQWFSRIFLDVVGYLLSVGGTLHRCGYFALWWALWLDQQEGPPLEALPGALPAMPGQFPALCWALLRHMTPRKVQLRVSPQCAPLSCIARARLACRIPC